MWYRWIPLILILCVGCRTTSKTDQIKVIGEANRDVIALSYLTRDYMRQTENTSFSLSDIIEFDTLGRVAKNFSRLEVANWPNVWRGGYAVYFKFSDHRNKDSILLSESERIPWKVKNKEKIGRKDGQLYKDFDGEIHYYYAERHFHIVEIILRKSEK
ncbi:MAG TPA: hypothetical protein P5550_09000 [Bacteroidales bacterium]|nr:hypothetical protein [Bacteroidales bacterium]HRZ76814.1 hypothetical protein [Bacteroidales bacterium]